MKNWHSGTRIGSWSRRGRAAAVGAITVLCMLGFYAALGFWALPYFGERRLLQALADFVQRPVSVQTLHVNPFALSIRIEGLRIYGPDAREIEASVERAYANFSAASLRHRAPILEALRIEEPTLQIVRTAEKRYNWEALVQRLLFEKEDDKGPARFALSNVELMNGRIEFADRYTGQHHQVRNLHIGIPFISSLAPHADVVIHPELSAVVNDAPIAAQGQTSPFGESKSSVLQLEIQGAVLAQYLDYLPFPLPVRAQSGTFSTQLQVRMVSEDGNVSRLSVGGLSEIRNLEVVQQDGEPMLRWKRFSVDLEELDFLARRLLVRAVALEEPALHLTRFRNGKLNVSLLWPDGESEMAKAVADDPSASVGPTQSESANPFTIEVQNAVLKSGRMVFKDYAAAGNPTTTLHDVSFAAKALGAEKKGAYTLQASVNEHGSLGSTGRIALWPVKAEGRLQMEGVRLAAFAPYAEPHLAEIAGTLQAAAQYALSSTGNRPQLQLSETQIRITEPRLRVRSAQPIEADAFALHGGELNFLERDLHIARVEATGLALAVLRDLSGEWSLAGLPDLQQGKGKGVGPAGDYAWEYSIDEIAVTDSALRVRDLSAGGEAVNLRLEDVNGSLYKFSSATGNRPTLEINASLGQRGVLRLGGPLAFSPFSAQWQVQAKDIPLAPLQPYWAQMVKLSVPQGRFGLKGNLRILPAGDQGGVELRFQGDAHVRNLLGHHTRSGEPLVRFDALRADNMSIATAPLRVVIPTVELEELYARLVIGPEGKLNWQRLWADEEGSVGERLTARARRERPDIRIEHIALNSGQLSFSDHYIDPNYSAEVFGLSGSVRGLSPQQSATIRMAGSLNERAPVRIEGEVNPFAEPLSLDINANAKGISLPPLSPYSARYIGYPIENGRMSLDVRYRIDNDRLTASNRLTLNQLDFGERIEDAEGRNIPVHLAVALLKDRNGVINLNVPISGSLEDPQFRIGGIVMRAIGNIFVRAVTSPFRAIGALFGGSDSASEELAYIDFDSGSAQLDQESMQKLDKLARALRERPALTLDIAGRASVEDKTSELIRDTLLHRLRRFKARELSANGPEVKVGDIELGPGDYERYIAQAYEAADFDKPRGGEGIGVADMHAALLENIQHGQSAARRLATSRAETVVDWLVEEGNIAPERLLVSAPQVETTQTVDGSRVDFTLR